MGERNIVWRLQKGFRWVKGSTEAGLVSELGERSLRDWQDATNSLTPWAAVDEVLSPVLFNGAPNEVDASSFLLAEKRSLEADPKAGLLRPSSNGESVIWGRIRDRLEHKGVRFRLGVK